MKKILVIATGGTIDAEPYEVTPVDITPLEHTMIPKALETLDLSDICDVHEFSMKDSKYIGIEEITQLTRLIEDKSEHYDHFIITHGTDATPPNGRMLKLLFEPSGITGKTIVFTGSMEPLLNGTQPTSAADIDSATSDGWKNLHYTINHIKKQPAGIYAGFDEKMMPIDKIRKDFKNKCFVEDPADSESISR